MEELLADNIDKGKKYRDKADEWLEKLTGKKILTVDEINDYKLLKEKYTTESGFPNIDKDHQIDKDMAITKSGVGWEVHPPKQPRVTFLNSDLDTRSTHFFKPEYSIKAANILNIIEKETKQPCQQWLVIMVVFIYSYTGNEEKTYYISYEIAKQAQIDYIDLADFMKGGKWMTYHKCFEKIIKDSDFFEDSSIPQIFTGKFWTILLGGPWSFQHSHYEKIRKDESTKHKFIKFIENLTDLSIDRQKFNLGTSLHYLIYIFKNKEKEIREKIKKPETLEEYLEIWESLASFMIEDPNLYGFDRKHIKENISYCNKFINGTNHLCMCKSTGGAKRKRKKRKTKRRKKRKTKKRKKRTRKKRTRKKRKTKRRKKRKTKRRKKRTSGAGRKKKNKR